jgi:hypothetical protein
MRGAGYRTENEGRSPCVGNGILDLALRSLFGL